MTRRGANNKVKVEITYIWEFSEADWCDFKKFQTNLQETIKEKVQYDFITAFHQLNNIVWPDCKKIKVNRVSDT